MNLVDFLSPEPGQPDYRPIAAAIGVGLLGLGVGALFLTKPKVTPEADARAAYFRSLSGPPAARLAAKAAWDALRVAEVL